MNSYDFWSRQREGGGTQILRNDSMVEKDENDRPFIKDIKNLVESLGYNNSFYENMEPIFKRIEKENNALNPTALILAMKFAVNSKDLNFNKNSYYNFNKFLQNEWKIINECLSRHGNNYFDLLFKSSGKKKMMNEDYIRYKIYKSKLKNDVHDSCNIQRYLALWKREIFLYQERLRINRIQFMNERETGNIKRLDYLNLEEGSKSKVYIHHLNDMYHSSLQHVKASNGTNACWINSVLYVFLSNPEMKTSLIYNQFIDKEMIEYVKSLMDGDWDDKLYFFYYKIFKKHCDDVVLYGQYGTPHFILSFIIEEMVNRNNTLFKIDMDFSITIYTVNDLREKLSDQQLYAVLKGVTKMTANNLNEEVNSDHFVSFIRNNSKENETNWILFDAMKGGSIHDKIDENYIFNYNSSVYHNFLGTATPNDSNENEEGSCPYFFLYYHDDLKR